MGRKWDDDPQMRKVSEVELKSCDIVDLSVDNYEWDPDSVNDTDIAIDEYSSLCSNDIEHLAM